jgi:hypothetical protein
MLIVCVDPSAGLIPKPKATPMLRRSLSCVIPVLMPAAPGLYTEVIRS